MCVSDSESGCDSLGCYNSAGLQEEVKLLGHSVWHEQLNHSLFYSSYRAGNSFLQFECVKWPHTVSGEIWKWNGEKFSLN